MSTDPTQPVTTPPPTVTINWKQVLILILTAIISALGGGVGTSVFLPPRQVIISPEEPKKVTPPPPNPALRPLAATPNANDSIALPADQQISSVVRTLIIEAKTAAPTVKWIVINSAADEKGNPIEVTVYEPKDKLLQIFPNQVDDVIEVYAYTSINGVPTDPVKTTVKVNGLRSTTPAPAPVPAPSGKVAAHVSFVFQKKQQILTVDQDTIAFMKANNIELHSPIYDDDDAVTKDGLAIGVSAAGGYPCFIIQDKDGNIIDQGKDFSSVRSTLLKYVK